jgi:hypothetical protein
MARKSKVSVESTEVLSGENAIQNKEIEGLSQGQIVRKRFFSSPRRCCFASHD